MTKTKVFTIKGSEDEIIAVMSNMTKAFERACEYLKELNEPMTISKGLFIKKATQQRFNECLNKFNHVCIECDWLSVEVDLFILNR